MQTIVIFLLLALSLWLFWRLYLIKRGIRGLREALEEERTSSRELLPSPSTAPPLSELSRVALDAISEANLVRDSEKQQRLFLEALLNEIKDAIFILDQDKEIRFLNQAAKILFPSEQPYIARAFIDVVRDHRIYDTLELAEEIGAKVSDRIELRVQEPDEPRPRELKMLIEAEPLTFTGSEENLGAWITLRDITQQLETEQIRKDFVANASHELRTPLSIINGYLETMTEDDVDLNNPANRRALKTMGKHGERIARIVDDMLTISKLEGAADLLAREPFDLRESVDDMASQLMPLVEETHARLKLDIDPKRDWILVGDRYYWDQIFFNLIENALKQNAEPGLRVDVSFRDENGRYIITVSDDGIGIPASDIPLIFKRFYRVEKHHAQNQVKGTGLGLSIVKRAVEAHNGTISVESTPGVRTAFTITIPQPRLPAGSEKAGRRESGDNFS